MHTKTHSSLRVMLVVFLASLISACGFQLRGEYTVPEELHQMSLTSYDRYSTLTRLIETELTRNNIDLVYPRADIPNLHLTSESIDERTLSLYQNARAAEKELTYNANYRVTVPEIGSHSFTATITRSYLDNPLTALAKSVEREMIEDEMRKLAATQIIRQMGRVRADLEAFEAIEWEENREEYKVKIEPAK
ncbi:LPS assembly lipoprotein LptE [Vibrio agarivorans]|uniref:LPS-assembly lipoprotein LptE n=1 Tax=Vibrio agarivorans TaxID=153622 RepID=A0ABT7Y165_9VIBR|nr:LPS assembly lipoprotein LptE [Vibrio agarivorans]MDN2481778.1 LPS assembly lipoprotein LptE [Vibrio agarivorans]